MRAEDRRTRTAGHGGSVSVFVSHASADTWVAKQIARQIRSRGAGVFLDAFDIAHGDEFDRRIREALLYASEFLVLMTPAALERPYVWIEVGAMWSQGKRMVLVLQGLSVEDLRTNPSIPDMIKAIDHVGINEVQTYFRQLRQRVRSGMVRHAR